MLTLLHMIYAKVVASYTPHHLQQALLRPDAWPVNLLQGVPQELEVHQPVLAVLVCEVSCVGLQLHEMLMSDAWELRLLCCYAALELTTFHCLLAVTD